MGEDTLGKITGAPKIAEFDPSSPEQTLSKAVELGLDWAFGIGTLVVLVMLIWGAFEFMTSAGEKSKLATARNRMIWSVVGLVVLAMSYGITIAIVRIFNPGNEGVIKLTP